MIDIRNGRRLLDASNGRLFNRLALHNERPTTDWHDWVLDNAEALLTFAERAQDHQLDYVRATPCASCGTHVTLCCTCGADFEDNTSAFNQHVQPVDEVRQ